MLKEGGQAGVYGGEGAYMGAEGGAASRGNFRQIALNRVIIGCERKG